MNSDRMNSIYSRLSLHGKILPAEITLLIKDFNLRISKLENTIEELERTASDRGRTSKVSKRKVSTD